MNVPPKLLRHLLYPLILQIRLASKKASEMTFIMVKPDGVQRGLVGKIVSRFEQKGFQLVAIKIMCAQEELLKEHYQNIADKPFFKGIIEYMSSGPVVPMVWRGLGVVKAGRAILGQTDPAKSNPGTVRGDFALHVGRNVCHGSDSVETASKEIQLWFNDEVTLWKSINYKWLYE